MERRFRSLCLGFVYFSVNLICLYKVFMTVKTGNLSIIHNDNSIRILYTRYSLCNDKFRGVWNLLCKSFTNLCICCRIYCTRTIVKNKYLWLFKKSPCNTKSLLLSTRHIRTALLNICMISFRHPVNKFICTGKTTGSFTFFLRCILITPAKIIKDCP